MPKRINRVFIAFKNFIGKKIQRLTEYARANTKVAHYIYKGEKMSAQNIDRQGFETLKSQDKPLFIEFYKDGCSPCRAISPIVDELAQERDDIIVGKINVESEPELAAAFGVRGVPTTVVLKNGKVVNQSTGLRRKTELLALLDGCK